MTFLSGRTLAQARPRTPALLQEVGRLLGARRRGARAIPASGRRRPRPLLESRTRPGRDRPLRGRDRGSAPPPPRRSHFSALHRERVLPLAAAPRPPGHPQRRQRLERARRPPPASEGRAVTGLLDFGDMLEAWTVCEPAVAVAYAVFGEAGPLAAAAAVIAGYHEAPPLSEEDELAALFPLAAIRLCASVCLSAHRRDGRAGQRIPPRQRGAGLGGARRLADVRPRSRASAACATACGFALSRDAPAVEAWLAEHGRRSGRVVAADLVEGRRLRSLGRQPGAREPGRGGRHGAR